MTHEITNTNFIINNTNEHYFVDMLYNSIERLIIREKYNHNIRKHSLVVSVIPNTAVIVVILSTSDSYFQIKYNYKTIRSTDTVYEWGKNTNELIRLVKQEIFATLKECCV